MDANKLGPTASFSHPENLKRLHVGHSENAIDEEVHRRSELLFGNAASVWFSSELHEKTQLCAMSTDNFAASTLASTAYNVFASTPTSVAMNFAHANVVREKRHVFSDEH